jgi:hypothetical protein
VVSGTTYTFSVYVKPDTATAVQLLGRGASFSADTFANFNLTTGSLGNIGSDATASIEDAGNGWYRCVVTATATGSSTDAWAIALINNDASIWRYPTYAGTQTQLYIWGSQNEAGSFPTSYIPTEGSTVTRAADVASISGSNFSSWYRQDEGTVFSIGEGSIPTTGFPVYAELNDGSLVNRVTFGYLTASLAGLLVWESSAITVQLYPSTSSTDRKVAYAISSNDFAISADGGAALTTNSGNLYTPMVDMSVGSNSTHVSNFMNGTISRLTYWPTRLSNDTLQGITQ